ncbi:MAG: DUF4390 domain-containing protein [Xanthomonadaceae bacterium]|nr:DUF4390 domain-containing protein [Xanthomonadaceae bacterium]MDE1884940.1 DUF4390 domain-containing protein [Xanthomonadaceae bacterium]MDE1960426.1 DUF4390 domain-containing protein [Xanthomonadaceae bacterium]MDE2084814.1 DUF4390 domain-containing protein [Xanthomonadaceae bacterium]MDE2256507.1 DUF4390 domain-containing protein [Xanthomonadaceae bacterium]
MRLWTKIISILSCAVLTACAQAPGAFVVRSAALEGAALIVRSDWHPAPQVLDALDHGIELPFVVTLQALRPGDFEMEKSAQIRRHIRLRYFPLSRQYQMRDLEDATTRNYVVRALAVQAMENLRLTLAGTDTAGVTQWRVRIALDRDALPGALRLPALLQSAWHMDSETYTWRAQAG